MVVGGWQVAGGGWQVAGGGWWLAGGGWRPEADVRHAVHYGDGGGHGTVQTHHSLHLRI